MKVIKDVKVVQSRSSEAFRDELMWCVKHFQEKNLEVKIHNPHLITVPLETLSKLPFYYIAVVEGYENINPKL